MLFFRRMFLRCQATIYNHTHGGLKKKLLAQLIIGCIHMCGNTTSQAKTEIVHAIMVC
jgi:hypothetical protein